jgi:hypothetical protein
VPKWVLGGPFFSAQKKLNQYLGILERYFGPPKWVPCSAISARVKNYKQVLTLLEGCFYFGTHALLAVVDKFVIYTLPPLEIFFFIAPLSTEKRIKKIPLAVLTWGIQKVLPGANRAYDTF